MSNEYLYGAYGHLGQTVAQSSVQAGTVPVYFGLAPINLIRGYAKAGVINTPVKLSNMPHIYKTVGYASNWTVFSLCEAFAAHFNNPNGNIGPIYVVNVLDPDVHRKAEATNINLAFANGQATIKSETIILDTLALEEKAEGVDYSVDYNYTKGMVVISSLNEKITGTISASYFDVDTTGIDEDAVIGGVSDEGVYTGISALQTVYIKHNVVPNLVAAPGWSDKPAVYNALCNASMKINGHWYAFVCADIPLIDADGTTVDTRDKAKTWKRENGYTQENSKVYYPQSKGADGNIYHNSTLAIVEYMRTDNSHNQIPMETCGNKVVPVVAQYFGENVKNQGFDQVTASELTQDGISTVVFWGGNWVLWGDHTAAYQYGKDVDSRCIFDVSIRMLYHIINSFQYEWGIVIDEPFTKQLRDRIINREQEKLDALTAQGALIGSPKILFLESENSTTDMMNGDFRWDIPTTPTPPLKSATVYVAYTDAGFSAYFDKE